MSRLKKLLFSTRTMTVLLLLFGISMAVATFVENAYDTPTAKALVYNSTWFEILMLWLILLFVSNIKTYGLTKREKWPLLIFHLAFIFMFIGGAITRYFSFEGQMPIRESETTNEIISDLTYFKLVVTDGVKTLHYDKYPYMMSHLNAKDTPWPLKRTFNQDYRFGDKIISLKTLDYIPLAKDSVQVTKSGKRIVHYPGDKNNPMDKGLLDVIQLSIRSGKERDTLFIEGGKGVTEYSRTVRINGLNVSLGFGSKILHTDFHLRCDNFLLDRYPGSNNPSSYESEITVIDEGTEKQHRIYMNNVMDYRGYRFFQASYFPDESGTILSVNADRWGTNITYFGYLLLFAAMFLTLFWKGTRFWKLNKSLKQMHTKTTVSRALAILLWIGIGVNTSFAQNDTVETNDTRGFSQRQPGPDAQFARRAELGLNNIVNPVHAKKFGRLLVQDFQGRIKPLDTHALELLRKIYKKDEYKNDVVVVSALQWFISMQIDPGYWANEPLIKVSPKGGDQLMKETGANADGYTSYARLVDPNSGIFKLEQQANRSFSRRKADQSNYDKALIEVTERFNIFSNIAFGYYTNVIPVRNDPARKWRSWIYNAEENAVHIDETAYAFLTPYFNAVKEGLQTGRWTKADQSIEEISAFQQASAKDILPSESKINLEILYNHLNVFFWLMIAYSLLGISLIILGFAEVSSSRSKYRYRIRALTKTFLGIMVMAMSIQGIALGVRWYISGHAPWSNGYEAIIFISGIGVLAGLLLYRNRNPFIPAAGSLVAMIMMGFAHGGSMLDPQITPLEPVLKSYWLMVHVGIITSSYGFFGLSAVLSSISLMLFCAKSKNKIEHSIRELTIVNEMALTVGIFALTVGTFLGGMWANESWGRYWSWDPKETWAFISIISYAVVLHLRLVPKLSGKLTFSIVSLWAIWSIIFTYFGVNYYLTGLHSYAAGDPIPIPAWIYITAAGMLALSVVAYYRNTVSNKGKLIRLTGWKTVDASAHSSEHALKL